MVLHRWVRRLIFGLGALLLLPVVAILSLQLTPVATWAVRRLVGFVPLNPGYTLEIGRVRGNWLSALELDDVRLRYERRELVRLRRVQVSYNLRQLPGAETRIERLVIDSGMVTAQRGAGGWDIANAIQSSPDTAASKGGVFVLGRLEVRGVEVAAAFAPDSVARVQDLVLLASDLRFGEIAMGTLDTIGARIAPPVPEPQWLSLSVRGAALADAIHLDGLQVSGARSTVAGTMVVPRRWNDAASLDRLSVMLDAAPLAMADVAAWVPGVRPDGNLQLTLRATGDSGTASGQLTGTLGKATLDLTGTTVIGTNAPIAIIARGALRELDPSAVYASAPAGLFNGDLDVDLRGPALRQVSGRATIKVGNVSGETAVLEQFALEADVTEGRAAVAILADLGAPANTPGPAPAITASGWVRPFDSVPSYRLIGSVRHLPGTAELVRRLVGADGDPTLAVRFEVTGRDIALERVDASGRIDLIVQRWGDDRVTLGQVPFSVANSQFVARPAFTVADGRIGAVLTADFGDTIRYTVQQGTVDSIDLSRVLGDTAAGALSGTFSGVGQGTTPADAFAMFRADIASLAYGRRPVEGLKMTARLARGEAQLRADGPLEGGRLTIAADARPFDSVQTFTLHRVALDRVDLGTLLGQPKYAGPVTLRMTGRGQLSTRSRSVDARLVVEPSNAGALEIRGGEMTAALRGDSASFDGTFRTSAGALTLAGTAAALQTSPVYTIARARFDSLDLAAFSGQSRFSSRLNGQAKASLAGHGLDSLRAALDLILEPSHIGNMALQNGRLALTADRGTIRGTMHLESSDGRMDGEAVLNALTDSAGLAGLGGTVTAGGAMQGVQLDTLRLVLSPVPGTIAVDTLILRSNIAVMDGAGRVALRPSAGVDTLRIVGATRDLAPLAALAAVDTIMTDSATLRLIVTGPAQQWDAAAEAAVNGLRYAGNHAQRIAFRTNARIDTSGLAGVSGTLQVTSAGVGRTRIEELMATVRYDSLVALQATVALPDSVRLTTALEGTVDGDTIQTTLTRLDLAEGGRVWKLERPTKLTLRPRIDIDSLVLRAGDDRRIAVGGVFDPKGRNDLSLGIVGLELETFNKLDLVPVPGRLDATFHLTGTAKAPSLEGRAGLVVQRGATASGNITADVVWNQRGLRLNAAAVPSAGGQLSVRGTLPWVLSFDSAASALTGSDTLGLVVRADSFSLAFFDPLLPSENAKDLRGMLAVDVRVTGTPEVPAIAGGMQLTEFGVALPPLGVTYKRSELVGEFTNDALRITRFRLGTDRDKVLTAEGVIRFRPLTNPAFDIAAEMRNFVLSNSAMLRASSNGKLQLSGTAETPVLTGLVQLGRTEYFQGAASSDVVVKEVELTEADRRELVRYFGPAVLEQVEEGPGLVERFRLDLKVEFERNVWFRRRVSPKADIEVAGNIEVKQEPGGEMEFFGTVEPVSGRGFLDVYGRNFRLTGGEIMLAGPVDSASFNVTAQYQVPTQSSSGDGILIDVIAKGRPERLSLDFSSEPSMTQEDVISYLITGRPSSEDPLGGESGSASETGAKLAFGAISEQLSNAAGQSLGLDVFQIKQDGLRGLTLTAGRYVAPRVFMSIQQPIQLSSDAQQTPGASTGPAFELEYAIRRWLRLNMRGGSAPPRAFFRTRYAY